MTAAWRRPALLPPDAAPVLRGALGAALDEVSSGPRGNDDLAGLADALTTALALLVILRAFLVVDLGGLQEVAP